MVLGYFSALPYSFGIEPLNARAQSIVLHKILQMCISYKLLFILLWRGGGEFVHLKEMKFSINFGRDVWACFLSFQHNYFCKMSYMNRCSRKT